MFTNEQINRAIAKQRGVSGVLRVIAQGEGKPDYRTTHPLDYCKDWAAAGPLMETMASVQHHPYLGEYGRGWTLYWAPLGCGTHAIDAPSGPEAIARAYHAAFCNEAAR